jgi:TP901 family phage tail tape measure protein
MIGRNVIQVIIQGQDHASPAFASAGAGATKAGTAFKGAGMMYAAGGIAIALGIKKTIDAATALNREMANVGTLIPGQAGRLYQLRDAVQDLSISTNRSTTDIAQGLYMTISALGDTAESMKILDIAARSATAGLSTLPDSVRLLTAVMKGYNDVSATSAERVADLAFETVRLGVTTFPELADSMGRVIPLAAALNISQEELFAGYATLTGVTGNAAMVSTQLSSVIRGLLKPTDDMKLAMHKLGYATAEELIEARGLVGGMRDLIATTDGTSGSLAKLWENARGFPALFSLTGEQAATFDYKLGEIRDGSGALTKAFKEQTEGINKYAVEVERLGKAFTILQEKSGENFLPAVGESASELAHYVNLLTKIVDKTGGMSDKLWDYAKGLSTFTTALDAAFMLIKKIDLATEPEPPDLTPATGEGSAAEFAQGPLAGPPAGYKSEFKTRDALLKIENGLLEQAVILAERKIEKRRQELEIIQQIADHERYMAESAERGVDAMTAGLDLQTVQADGLQQSGAYAALEDTQAMLANMTLTGEDAAHILSDNFAMFFDSIIMGSESVEEAFQNMMKSIFSMFFTTVIKMIAFKALFKIFGGPLGELVPMNAGGEVVGAAYGLEVIGGTPGRDTVPALIGGGEAVVPSPTMGRLRHFLDRAEAGLAGGGAQRNRPINLFTLFSTGSEVERVVVGGYVESIEAGFSEYVIEGTL